MSTTPLLGKRKREEKAPHPYLVGNFAPIDKCCPLTPCQYTGQIPPELAGGQYVRNGSNPVTNEDLGREAHWFDGDGMLTGVSFARGEDGSTIKPEFVNQYVLTDLYLSATTVPSLKKPILPSIATFVNPLGSVFRVMFYVLRGFFLAFLSRWPGSKSVIKKISVANTAIMYHDGRALATCESGPPLRVQLPSLDTVGWYNGVSAEGEPTAEVDEKKEVLGGPGFMGWIKEWTTAHPKVDPLSGEMIMFHSSFGPPYVHYSVLPAEDKKDATPAPQRLVNKAIAGVSGPRMMHDFGVSHRHTVIMDLPLTLDPLQTVKGKPPIIYDIMSPARFGVFPRHEPSNVRWFETAACCIFHTANTWDVYDDAENLKSVDMLACRMTSASVVFNAGHIAAPQSTAKTVKEVVSAMPEKMPQNTVYEVGPELESPDEQRLGLRKSSSSTQADLTRPYEDEQCRLYYFSFSMSDTSKNPIAHQFALSAIPFEFPSTRSDKDTLESRFVYGCTTISGTFNSALGRDAKVDGLVKFDTRKLLQRAKKNPPMSITGCYDERRPIDIVNAPFDPEDPIQIFATPKHFYAQEPRFVPAKSAKSEDDGFLITYMFDERQLGGSLDPPASAVSELWIIDAKNMKEVVAKIQLPQRVPYGLHGNWFSEQQVLNQRPIERIRERPSTTESNSRLERWIQTVSNGLIRAIGG